jgi:hypothetical protein
MPLCCIISRVRFHSRWREVGWVGVRVEEDKVV